MARLYVMNIERITQPVYLTPMKSICFKVEGGEVILDCVEECVSLEVMENDVIEVDCINDDDISVEVEVLDDVTDIFVDCDTDDVDLDIDD
jgi:hypothetical protein